MNTLFVFRNLFPRTLFCARKLSQGYIFRPKNYRNFSRHFRSPECGLKNDSKSIIFVGIQTMSAANGENSSLLDNLRKSVKEQVCSKCFSVIKKRIDGSKIFIWFCTVHHCQSDHCKLNVVLFHIILTIFGNLNGSRFSETRKAIYKHFQKTIDISYLEFGLYFRYLKPNGIILWY